MSLSSIIILVLVAAILLAILFTFFHILLFLLPAIIILIVIFWIAGWFIGRKNKDMIERNIFSWTNNNANSGRTRGRKKARNVKTKDVDD